MDDGGLVASSSSSSTTTPTGGWTYDVFLSFRGEDTRNNFVDHLYAALDQAGIYTFKDDEKLQRGKSISLELLKAIEESRVAVVVFSENYANSSWCLEELAKIVKCRDVMGQKVLPVFYDVDPSDVRGQKRSFHAAFEQHEVKFVDNIEKVKKWREALETAANISGWDVSRVACGREAECIKQIVRNIMSYTESNPAENLFGMGSRVRHVKSMLSKGSGDVCMIGIWGMGGIGKTTTARAVYRQISCEFDGSSFVEDVRENGFDNRGLKSLQEKLLSEILMQENFKVKDCDDGMCQIRRRLSRKKVLVVLDDVDNIKQLEFLAGAHEWFGRGSRIMITTRDKHLLSYAQESFALELLNEGEAMRLFSRYAFKENNPPKAYEELSRDVVSHTGHLPLALKVLGSHFCNRNLEFWKSGLKVLAKIPHKEINGILKLSYDGLNILEKKIFLHIACFFKAKDVRYVTRVLDSLGYEAASGITVLIEKSLLTIANFGSLHMHDLIQEMGQWIVREYYSNNMVWDLDNEVMTTIARLEMVEVIVETKHDDIFGRTIPCCSGAVFKSMKKLRLLQVVGNFTSSEPTHFPEELRWLSWLWYPFQSLRITRCLTKLVGLVILSRDLKLLQIEEKLIFTNLKFMCLRGSNSVTSFPDISGVPNLELLNLSYCRALVEVHQSVLLHGKIIHLDLNSCHKLKVLSSFINMKSLKTLVLYGCSGLESFPEVSGEMGRLFLLNIDYCKMMESLPLSIKLLTGLNVLIMGVYRMEEEDLEQEIKQVYSNRINNLCTEGSEYLSSLRILSLRQNDLVDGDFPANLHVVCPSLEEVDLSRNLITQLPATIFQLSYLKYINLRRCPNLVELHELPPLIQVLKANCCKSLEKIGDLSNYKWLFQISLHWCPKLLENQESQNHLANCVMKSMVQKCAAVNHRLSIAVPGTSIPIWFNSQRLGNKILLNLPRDNIDKMKGLAICCLFRSHVIELTQKMNIHTSLGIKFNPACEETLIDSPARAPKRADDVLWIGYMSIDILRKPCHAFESENLMVSIECDNDIMECGVCVVYQDDIKGMTGIGPWIPDYDELEEIDKDSANNGNILSGRYSRPTIRIGDKVTGDCTTIHVDF